MSCKSASFYIKAKNLEYIDDQIKDKPRYNKSNWLDDLIDHLRAKSKPAVVESETVPDNSDCIEVINYLNLKLGTKYKASTKLHIQNISARIEEGHSVDDLKSVIDAKWLEWGNKPKWAQYLRPKTLFGAGNFQGYLTASKTVTTGRNRKVVDDEDIWVVTNKAEDK